MDVSRTHVPLYRVVAEVAALWAAAMAGYFVVLPVFGIDVSYNIAPIPITLYFIFWLAVSIYTFWDLFYGRLRTHVVSWTDGVLSLAFAGGMWAAMYVFSSLPSLSGPSFAPFSDILFATPWYFLPKAVEILIQQVLIAALTYSLADAFGSLKKVSLAYALCFGGAHVVFFALSGAPSPYAMLMTLGAVASSSIFPYLLLRVRRGFLYSYIIHVLFYIILALTLHAWPPPDYGV